jgi:hypothetical protein
MADAGSGDLYQHFVGCRVLNVDLGEGEWCAYLLHHRG